MPEGFTLRACEPRDLEEIVGLEKDSFPDHPYGRIDFLAYLLMARDSFIVASAEGRVVGYVIAVRRGREGSVQSVAVAPGYRRRGVGEALMSSALEVLSGRADRVRLLVDAENAGAIGLYRKLSFEETGRVVKSYYPNGHDAVEMARGL